MTDAKLGGKIRREFAGHERDFRLTIGDIEEIELILDKGIFDIARDIGHKALKVYEMRVIIEIALRSAGADVTTETVQDLLGNNGIVATHAILNELIIASFGGPEKGKGTASGKAKSG